MGGNVNRSLQYRGREIAWEQGRNPAPRASTLRGWPSRIGEDGRAVAGIRFDTLAQGVEPGYLNLGVVGGGFQTDPTRPSGQRTLVSSKASDRVAASHLAERRASPSYP